jgi:glycosyl hydrolase family 43
LEVQMGRSRREFLVDGGASFLLASTAGVASHPNRMSFKPGALWLDASGKPIQAHGGSIIAIGDRFYWYGSDHSKATPGSLRLSEGIRLYESTDLYNWHDRGLIIQADNKGLQSPLSCLRHFIRPHIAKSPRTGKFVCWMVVDDPASGLPQHVALLSDRIIGPYHVSAIVSPLGYTCGDFDIVVDHLTGRAWQIFNRSLSDIFIAEMTPEYTGFTGDYTWAFSKSGPPLAREAPAHFTRDGKHYLATSGSTGWHPNPSEIAFAPDLNGPWTVIGDLHPSDASRTSFGSQISSIFKHPTKRDLYIALGDRWVTDLPTIAGTSLSNGDAYLRTARIVRTLFSRGYEALNEDDKRYFEQSNGKQFNLSRARYVWLPLQFTNGRPSVSWRDDWSIDEFD